MDPAKIRRVHFINAFFSGILLLLQEKEEET